MKRGSTRVPSIVLGIIVLLIGLGPILVGAINSFQIVIVVWLVAAIFLMLVTIFPLTQLTHRAVAQNITLMFTTLSLAITIFDLLLRMIHPQIIYHRPEERFIVYYPQMPLVVRYRPNLRFEDLAQGELSAILGNRDYAVIREISLYTDPYGFRNSDPNPDDIDLIVLGDSYGLSVSAAEAAAWSNLLRDQYDLSVYNLSAPSSSPWREYMNLAMEIDRLDTHEDTILVWLIFTGNDLTDDYGPIYDPDQLPYQTGLSAFATSWWMFSLYSPTGLTTERLLTASTLTEEQAKPVTITTFLDDKPLLFSNLYLENQALSADEIYRHENYPPLKESIAKGIRLARAKGLKPVIILVPTKGEVYEWVLNEDDPWSTPPDPSGFSEVIAKLSARNDVCYFDLKPYLIDTSRQVYEETGDLIYWHDDTHWNEHGNAAVARWIYDTIYQNNRSGNPCQ